MWGSANTTRLFSEKQACVTSCCPQDCLVTSLPACTGELRHSLPGVAGASQNLALQGCPCAGVSCQSAVTTQCCVKVAPSGNCCLKSILLAKHASCVHLPLCLFIHLDECSLRVWHPLPQAWHAQDQAGDLSCHVTHIPLVAWQMVVAWTLEIQRAWQVGDCYVAGGVPCGFLWKGRALSFPHSMIL